MSDAQQRAENDKRAQAAKLEAEVKRENAMRAAQQENADETRERLKAEREVADMRAKVEEAEEKAAAATERVAALEAKMSEAMMNAGIGIGTAHTITADHTGKPAQA